MKNISKLISFLIKSSYSEKEVFFRISFNILLSIFLVKFVPLKFYYKNYFVFSDNIMPDMQPFSGNLRLLRKVKDYCPFRITCLIETMAIHSFLKNKHKTVVPIRLGVYTGDRISAHAWIGDSTSCHEFQKIPI